MWKTAVFNYALAIVLFFTLAELGARLVFPSPPLPKRDDRNRLFSYDAQLGWSGKKNIRSYHDNSILAAVESNSEGFRDSSHEKKMGSRLLILGDSFVWGVDVQQHQRFSELLKTSFPRWEIINAGISGYGTDQELLLLKKIFPKHQPDAVFLLFCVENDKDDIATNSRYGGYYKPYFIRQGEGLILLGTPVPKSLRFYSIKYPILFKSRFISISAKVIFDRIHPKIEVDPPLQPLLQEIKNFTEQNGAKFLMGLTLEDPETEAILQKLKIPYILLSTPHRFPLYGNHWTPEGHREVAHKLYPWLASELGRKPTNKYREK